ncbi:hypothetical protein B0H15DRAFT_857322 [Mycena belliarum]|uniref:Uncharacterized protein n=1 Tax=Mycena belliarum TaxID=1033014 RepID=A0AAD6XLX5_9AGAR|nr:hypothetical protein B0H15DRAFT_857322 [Mycena belliae]
MPSSVPVARCPSLAARRSVPSRIVGRARAGAGLQADARDGARRRHEPAASLGGRASRSLAGGGGRRWANATSTTERGTGHGVGCSSTSADRRARRAWKNLCGAGGCGWARGMDLTSSRGRRRLGRAGAARLPSRASRGARALRLWTEPIGADGTSMRRRGVEGTGGGPAAPGRAIQDARRTPHADDGSASRRREKEGKGKGIRSGPPAARRVGVPRHPRPSPVTRRPPIPGPPSLRASRIVGHAARRRADAGGELPGADAGSHRAADAPPRPAPVHAASISACVVCVSTLACPHLPKARKCRARRRPQQARTVHTAGPGCVAFIAVGCVCVPTRIEAPRAPASCPFAHPHAYHVTFRSVDLLRPSWPRKSRKWRQGNACRRRAAFLQHPPRLPQHPNEDCASPLWLFAA